MSLLDQALGALAGGQPGGNSALLQSVMQLVNNPQNGGRLLQNNSTLSHPGL